MVSEGLLQGILRFASRKRDSPDNLRQQMNCPQSRQHLKVNAQLLGIDGIAILSGGSGNSLIYV
jgi:hypothetical protein